MKNKNSLKILLTKIKTKTKYKAMNEDKEWTEADQADHDNQCEKDMWLDGDKNAIRVDSWEPLPRKVYSPFI